MKKIRNYFDLSDKILELSEESVQECREIFEGIDELCEINTGKVLEGFRHERVSEGHLWGSSGYGYDDRGRDTLDKVFARIFGAEDALVRHNFVSGTAAIGTALFGVLRAGDRMVSLCGRPYDTLHTLLGLGEKGTGSLPDFGITYSELALCDEEVDLEGIAEAVKGAKVAYIQRSRGYSLRRSLRVSEIGEIIQRVKLASPNTVVIVDNCYGEFVQTEEPCEVGADLIVGSLIKNPGGGIARTGGYIAGRRELIRLCAYRMTAPGIGREVGCTLGENKNMYMGLFLAPTVVANAMKTAVFAASIFGKMGYKVSPRFDEQRADIIQSVILGSPERLTAFCAGIQSGAAIDSFVVPEAWEMPGYDSPVIMAAGSFNLGASIELSADAPMREPYAAWLQGGLTWHSGKIGIMLAAQKILEI